MTLNASSGAISGTPTTAGTSNFTVQVRDSAAAPATATKALTLTVAAAPVQLTVTTASLAGGTAGTSYSATVQASGGTTPYTWSVSSGTLPVGLALNASSGAISGTPTTAGTSSFTVQVRDSAATPATATKALTLTVAAAPVQLTVTTASLAGGTAGTSYSATVQASGGTTPYTWSVSSGTLPAGLALNASSGAISGTPTTAGTSNFTVQVRDSAATPATATKALTLTVAAAPVQLTVTTASLAGGTVGTSYSATVQASGGTTPYTWSASSGTLPAGLALNASSGAISGTPTTAGTSNFTVQVRDSAATPATATKALTLTVAAAPVPLAVTTASVAGGTVGTSYSATLQASGGTTPYTWSVSSGTLPAGLTLNASSGAISGTPTAAGTSNFTAQVRDSAATPATATKALTLTVAAAPVPPAISTSSLPDGTVGVSYSATMAATGGTGTYSWSLTGQLPGVTLSGSALTGTPTTAGTYNLTVTVSDSATPPATASKAFTVTIAPAAPPVTNGSPVIFFTDLQSGPNTGGENGKGAYVTIYGANFGSSGTVTVGGGAVDHCPVWGATWLWYQKISCQLGANAQTGNIVVSASNGTSNGVPFTVRSGNIYFVSISGSDSNAGSFAAPWRHLSQARDGMSAGDIAYLRGGTYTTSGEDSGGDNFYVSPSYPWKGAPTASAPNAIVGYPGEAAIVQGSGIINWVSGSGDVDQSSNIVFAGFIVDANNSGGGLSWRGVGNGASATTRVKNIRIAGVEVKNFKDSGNCGGTAAMEFGGDGPLDNVKLLGVHVHNVDSSSRLDHGIYLSAGGDNFEIGWSSIHDVKRVSATGCDGHAGWGIQIYRGTASNYANANNASIHDSMVYETPHRGGINLADYAKSSTIYNNVIYRAGYDNTEEGYGLRITADDSSGIGTQQVYNNTFYSCGGSSGDSAALGLIAATAVTLRNNIVVSSKYAYNGIGNLTSSNNLWSGGGSAPSWDSASKSADPLFVNAAGGDFHLQAGSPAIDAGYSIAGLSYDIQGTPRPQGSAIDIGADEYSTGSSSSAETGGATAAARVSQSTSIEAAPVTTTAATSTSTVGAQLTTGTTWYIRIDGGNRQQCTGTTDAPYPGSGTNQPCAFNSVYWLAADGSPASSNLTWIAADNDLVTIKEGASVVTYRGQALRQALQITK